jgi:hypothetical protein
MNIKTALTNRKTATVLAWPIFAVVEIIVLMLITPCFGYAGLGSHFDNSPCKDYGDTAYLLFFIFPVPFYLVLTWLKKRNGDTGNA